MSYFKMPAGANTKIYDINRESPQRAVWRIRIPVCDTVPITLVDGAGLVVTSNCQPPLIAGCEWFGVARDCAWAMGTLKASAISNRLVE